MTQRAHISAQETVRGVASVWSSYCLCTEPKTERHMPFVHRRHVHVILYSCGCNELIQCTQCPLFWRAERRWQKLLSLCISSFWIWLMQFILTCITQLRGVMCGARCSHPAASSCLSDGSQWGDACRLTQSPFE